MHCDGVQAVGKMPVDVGELGVDLFNPGDRKKVFQLLNSPEYRYLKVTDMYADS